LKKHTFLNKTNNYIHNVIKILYAFFMYRIYNKKRKNRKNIYIKFKDLSLYSIIVLKKYYNLKGLKN